MKIPRLCIIGVGLIGGSLALSLKKNRLTERVIGIGRSAANLELAKRLGAIDEIADSSAAVAEADMVVLSTPVKSIAGLFTEIKPFVKSHTIITDVGSVKVGICKAAAALGDNHKQFVAAHPVAGKEHSGVAAANADLFKNHNVVLTPDKNTDPAAIELVSEMWQATGAKVRMMEAESHDRVLALTSHLPHMLAYAMVDLFANSADANVGYDMAAGGFYDFTRTASSDAEMWRDICLMNRHHLLTHIDQFANHLSQLRTHIENADGDTLAEIFAAAKRTRAAVDKNRSGN